MAVVRLGTGPWMGATHQWLRFRVPYRIVEAPPNALVHVLQLHKRYVGPDAVLAAELCRNAGHKADGAFFVPVDVQPVQHLGKLKKEKKKHKWKFNDNISEKINLQSSLVP